MSEHFPKPELTVEKKEIWLRRRVHPLERYLAAEIFRFSDGVIFLALYGEAGDVKEMCWMK